MNTGLFEAGCWFWVERIEDVEDGVASTGGPIRRTLQVKGKRLSTVAYESHENLDKSPHPVFFDDIVVVCGSFGA